MSTKPPDQTAREVTAYLNTHTTSFIQDLRAEGCMYPYSPNAEEKVREIVHRYLDCAYQKGLSDGMDIFRKPLV